MNSEVLRLRLFISWHPLFATSHKAVRLDTWVHNIDYYILSSDQEIKDCLEAIGKRLDSLEDIMAQQNTTGECPMETTGSFLNPADNCSHILHHNPQATSGIIVFIAHGTKFSNSCVHR